MLEKSCRWWPIWYLLLFCHGAEGISTIISYNYWLLMYSFPYTQRNTPLFHIHREIHSFCLVIFHTLSLMWPIIFQTQKNAVSFSYGFPYKQGNTSHLLNYFPYTQGNLASCGLLYSTYTGKDSFICLLWFSIHTRHSSHLC